MQSDAQTQQLAHKHYLEGNAHFNENRLENAIECYQNAILLQPDIADYHYNLGNTYFSKQDIDRSIPCYQTAIQNKSDFVEAYFNLSHAYEIQQKIETAIRGYHRVIAFDADCVKAFDRLAKLQLQQGNLEEAIEHYQTIVRHGSDCINCYTRWLISLESQGTLDNWRRDRLLFIQDLQTQNISSQIFFFLGNTLYRQNLWNLAIEAYRRSIDLQPDFFKAYRTLGTLYNQCQQHQKAIECLKTALQLQPGNEKICIELAQSFAFLKHYDIAISLLKKFIKNYPNAAEVSYYCGKLLWVTCRFQEAIEQFRQAGRLETYRGRDVFSLGIALAQAGKVEESLEALNPQQRVSPPQGYFTTTRDWMVSKGLEHRYQIVNSSYSVELQPPQNLEAVIGETFQFSETFVAEIPEGRAYWSGDASRDDYASAVITPDNYFLADVSIDFTAVLNPTLDRHPSQHRLLKMSKLAPIEEIDGTVAVISPINCDNYYHWMIYLLPRLLLIKSINIDLNEIDIFWMDSFCKSFQKETFQKLEIPETKVLTVDRSPHIRAKSLIVPSLTGNLFTVDRASCQRVRDLFLPDLWKNIPQTKRLYIRRSFSKNRRVVDEEKLIGFLEQYNFESVELEGRSIQEQVQLFAESEIVISPHGAGLTNIIFCRPQTKVIELLPPNYPQKFYWILSTQCQLLYYCLMEENFGVLHFESVLLPNVMQEDIWVNPERLRNILNSILS
ncbi:MAG: DUF563 domain-containing protein [Cyanobacteria bacterium SID2]|nr:DUF563 domain-containing protein [Cyanobacteria bacterium SID2]